MAGFFIAARIRSTIARSRGGAEQDGCVELGGEAVAELGEIVGRPALGGAVLGAGVQHDERGLAGGGGAIDVGREAAAGEQFAGAAGFGLGDEEFEPEIAVACAEILGEAEVGLDDGVGKEFPLFLHGQQPIGKEEAAAIAVVADDARDECHLAKEGGFERVWEEEGEVKLAGAEARGDVEQSLAGARFGFAGAVGEQLIGPGHCRVERLYVAAEQVADVGVGVAMAEGAEGWGCHDGIADPTGLDDQNSAWVGHRLEYSTGGAGFWMAGSKAARADVSSGESHLLQLPASIDLCEGQQNQEGKFVCIAMHFSFADDFLCVGADPRSELCARLGSRRRGRSPGPPFEHTGSGTGRFRRVRGESRSIGATPRRRAR